MTRQQTRKSSLGHLWFRWYAFSAVVSWPIYVLFESEWKSFVVAVFLVATIIAVSLSVFMRIWGGLVNGRSPDYHAWLSAGGSPFFDTLHWPLNPDPPQVRAAIGSPPPIPRCGNCGASLAGLFGLGGNYGNQCNNCGTYNDRFGHVDPPT